MRLTAAHADCVSPQVVAFESVGNDPTCSMQIVGNHICRNGDDVERYHEEQTVRGHTVDTRVASSAQRYSSRQRSACRLIYPCVFAPVLPRGGLNMALLQVNTLVLTLRKGKTVSGCIELAAKAQALGWGVVAASESAAEAGETTDDFIAHLAIGTKAGQLRCV